VLQKLLQFTLKISLCSFAGVVLIFVRSICFDLRDIRSRRSSNFDKTIYINSHYVITSETTYLSRQVVSTMMLVTLYGSEIIR
jgi:hypothetical protein